MSLLVLPTTTRRLLPSSIIRKSISYFSTTKSVVINNNNEKKLMNLSFIKLDIKEDSVYGKPCGRSSHGFSVVNNGNMLVLYGGENIARTPVDSNHEAFWVANKTNEEESWQWKCCIENSGALLPARLGHAQAVVATGENDSIYVFGGRAQEEMNDLWKLNTKTLEWTEIITSSSTKPCPRSFHRMISIGKDSLYVFGGCGKEGRLADLHRFDIPTQTWHELPPSPLLRGRGGANLFSLSNQNKLAVIAGFAGEETDDGHIFSISEKQWESNLISEKNKLRPRSVCVSATWPDTACLIFGGEVDPSDKGHEGAGGHANDVVLVNPNTGEYIDTVVFDGDIPEPRGWSDGSLFVSSEKEAAHLYMFGGLAGDDTNPVRLDDTRRLDMKIL